MTYQGIGFSFPWEIGLMTWIQNSFGDAAISVVSHLSLFGEELVLILIIGFLYWSYDKKMGLYVGRNILMGLVWSPMVKNIFLRRRPYFDHPEIRIVRVVEKDADIYDIAAQGYSFPSGHSTSAAIVYGSVAAYKKKTWITVTAVVLCLLVGFSRVAVGAHYPTDVLAGWAVGVFAMIALPWLERTIRREWLLNLVLLLTALPGVFFCRSSDYYTGLGVLIGFIAGNAVERRFVRFENTRHPVFAVLRVAVGAALFFALNTAFKLPFSREFLEAPTMAAFGVRCARYAVVSFLIFGLYPLCFVFSKRLANRKAQPSGSDASDA